MVVISLLLLSSGLAMDAFAAAVAQGASSRPYHATALRMSIAFGLAQTIMPVLGWALGIAFASFMETAADWIALVLLSALGLRMIKEGFDRDAHRGASRTHISGHGYCVTFNRRVPFYTRLSVQTLFRSQGIDRIELCRAPCGKISKYDPDYGGEQEADNIYLDIELEFQAH